MYHVPVAVLRSYVLRGVWLSVVVYGMYILIYVVTYTSLLVYIYS